VGNGDLAPTHLEGGKVSGLDTTNKKQKKKTKNPKKSNTYQAICEGAPPLSLTGKGGSADYQKVTALIIFLWGSLEVAVSYRRLFLGMFLGLSQLLASAGGRSATPEIARRYIWWGTKTGWGGGGKRNRTLGSANKRSQQQED